MTAHKDGVSFTLTIPRRLVEEAIAKGSLRFADGSPMTYEQAVELLKNGSSRGTHPR